MFLVCNLLFYFVTLTQIVFCDERYLSIGLRQAMMFCAHLSPEARFYSYLLPPATTWSSEPTVDRTLGTIMFTDKIIAHSVDL